MRHIDGSVYSNKQILLLIISNRVYKLRQIKPVTKCPVNGVKIPSDVLMSAVEAESSSAGNVGISDDAGVLDAVCQ